MKRNRGHLQGKQLLSSHTRHRGAEGFTLLELLVVLVILPIIIGGVAAAVIAELNNTTQRDPNGAYQRLADSHDTQITSAYFVRDVESAAIVSTASSPVFCHAPSMTGADQLLGLEWPSAAAQAAGATRYDVSYFIEPTTPPQFVRYYCVAGGYTSRSVVSHDVFQNLTSSVTLSQGASCSGASSCAISGSKIYASATVTCTDSSVTCANGGAWPVVPPSPPGVGISSVRVNVADNQISNYQYALTGVPRLASTGVSGQPPSKAPNPPFIANGPVSTSNCNMVTNGFAAINDKTDPALSLGPNGSFQGTGIYTQGGGASGGKPGSYPTPIAKGTAPVPSPYAKLKEPPTAPAGNPYPVVTINSANWDPSTLPQPLSPAIYVVTNGLSVTGNKGVSAPNGVLFYVTGGSVTLTGRGNLDLNPLAPNWEQTTDGSTAPLPEVVLWISAKDKTPNPPQLTLGGNGASQTFNGAIYAPTAQVTMNGGGTAGEISTQSFTVGSLTCNGGGSVPINLLVGSPLASGTINQANTNPITLTMSDQELVTVFGSGHLAPTGTVDVWECGPQTPSAAGCTKTTPGAVKIASAQSLIPDTTNGTATYTSPTVTPAALGWYCFASYYSGSVSYQPSKDESTAGCFYDAPAPSVTITSPVSSACYATLPIGPCPGTWPGSIAGNTSDPGGPGVQQVTVTIQDPKGKYWNGTAFASTTAVQVPSTTSDSWADWSLNFPSSNFPLLDTGSYKLTATAIDKNGISSSPAAETFTWNG